METLMKGIVIKPPPEPSISETELDIQGFLTEIGIGTLDNPSSSLMAEKLSLP
jgi:hypothetical protein